jgi:hypothetical protein
VAVEKVGFSEKVEKSGDRKCLEDRQKSFVELPDAKQFLRIHGERVFHQPPLFATPNELQFLFVNPFVVKTVRLVTSVTRVRQMQRARKPPWSRR